MRIIDGSELYNIEKMLDTEIVKKSPEASWLLSQVLHDIQASPEIDQESLPVVQQLRAEVEQLEKSRAMWRNRTRKLLANARETESEMEKVNAELDDVLKLLNDKAYQRE